MDLQSIFYVLAIMFLLLGILAMIGCVALVVLLYVKVRELHGILMEKLAYVEYLKNHPQEIVKNAVMGTIRSAVSGVKNFVRDADE